MWDLDENDPVDKLILQELRGEPIRFDQWEEMWDELEDEPDAAERLQAHGYTAERGQREGLIFREEFLQLLQKYDLSLSDRILLFYRLAELAASAPDQDLLYLYCAIVSDSGFLLDQNREPYQGDDGALHYLITMTGTSDLFCELQGRIRRSKTLRHIFSKNYKSPPLQANSDADMKYKVFQAYSNAFGADGSETELLNSIDDLLQMAAAYPELETIEPLFLYRAFTRHGKRLRSGTLLQMDLKSLWKYKAYRIDQDNGKNFKANLAHLTLFSSLCEIYQHEEAVDLPLCYQGFEMLSNLGEFYREQMPDDISIPFPEPMEDILLFEGPCCFEGGARNVILENDKTLNEIRLSKFRCDPKYERPLDHISVYLNQNLEELINRFWHADDETVKTLCNQILLDSKLPARWQPQNMQELSRFLATINNGLLDAMCEYADSLLVEAGQTLLDTL